MAGLLPLFFDAVTSKAVWGVSILGFFLMMIAIFRAVTEPSVTRGTPGFVWAALAFMVYALLNSLIQWHTPYETLSGFKRYFQAYGLLFAFAWLSISETDVRRWRWLLLVVALVQLPWAIYERIVLMPIREGLKQLYPYMVPYDVVAGTFGASMHEGGGSAEMATFLIIVFAFLLSRWREKLVGMGKVALATPFLLAPLFLGETKIVVVLLPLMFVVLFRREILSRPHVAAIALVAAAAMTFMAGYAYMAINKITFAEQLDQTISYNFTNRGYGAQVLNRTTVLTFWAGRQGFQDPTTLVIGNGLGSAHDKMGGHVSQRYYGYGIGLTTASTLLWEQGLFGSTLFALIVLLAWFAVRRLLRTARTPWVHADAAAIEASLPLFAIYVFYRLTLLELLGFQIVFCSLLGYLAWLVRYEIKISKQTT